MIKMWSSNADYEQRLVLKNCFIFVVFTPYRELVELLLNATYIIDYYLQFKDDFERQIFEKIFMVVFI